MFTNYMVILKSANWYIFEQYIPEWHFGSDKIEQLLFCRSCNLNKSGFYYLHFVASLPTEATYFSLFCFEFRYFKQPIYKSSDLPINNDYNFEHFCQYKFCIFLVWMPENCQKNVYCDFRLVHLLLLVKPHFQNIVSSFSYFAVSNVSSTLIFSTLIVLKDCEYLLCFSFSSIMVKIKRAKSISSS